MGEWREDQMEGQGEYTFKSGKVYTGSVRGGNFDG